MGIFSLKDQKTLKERSSALFGRVFRGIKMSLRVPKGTLKSLPKISEIKCEIFAISGPKAQNTHGSICTPPWIEHIIAVISYIPI